MTKAITKLRSIINSDAGMAYANEYEVKFDFGAQSKLRNALSSAGFNATGDALSNMVFLCDEASLPGQFTSTQEFDGRYVGKFMQYANTKLYNDFSLSFMVTNKANPVKFFDAWMYFMFPEQSILSENNRIARADYKNRALVNNSTVVSYYDDYVCEMIEVRKFYKTKDAANGGFSVKYNIMRAYPFSIEAIPLGYGASTLVKLRVNFKYEKFIVQY